MFNGTGLSNNAGGPDRPFDTQRGLMIMNTVSCLIAFAFTVTYVSQWPSQCHISSSSIKSKCLA